MLTKTSELQKFFENNGGTVRFSALLKAGFHPDTIRGLEKDGKAVKIARGLYRIKDSMNNSYPDIVEASIQATRGVICLISALAYHEATDEIPEHVDMAIRSGERANKIDYPPVKFYRFEAKAWKSGIKEHIIEGHKVRIYDLAKTVADCYKFRNKIGVDIARHALKTAVLEKRIKPLDIMKYAKICRVDEIMKPVMEAII